jgi:hypothetical protein
MEGFVDYGDNSSDNVVVYREVKVVVTRATNILR